MASLSELVDYAKAKQQRNGLAEIAGHFLEGASGGYDAGKAQARKDQEDPLIADPVTGEKKRLSVVSKLLDVHDKLASIQGQEIANAYIKSRTGSTDLNNRQGTLAKMADNANAVKNGAAGDDKSDAGKIANLVTDSNAQKGKVKVGIKNGKPTIDMEFDDPKKTSINQMEAIKNYVAKNGDADSSAALTVAFPDGLSDDDKKFMLQHTEIKQKQDAIANEKNAVRTQQRIAKMSEALDPSKQRQGAFGVSKQVFDRAERLQSLAGAFPDGNLDSRQIEELAIGLNSMLSGSNTGAQAQVASLVPKTIIGNATKLKEWLVNDPQGTSQQAFVQRMLGSVEREKQTASDQIKRTQLSRLTPFAGLEKDDPESFNATLQSFGIEPSEYQEFKKGGRKPASAVVKSGEDASGKIKVSNGKETLLIDPADAAEAAKDGYKTL